MSFQPVVPLAGYAGWTFLTRTLERQQEAHASAVVRQRDTDYFAERIGTITSAEELVEDRRLLSVALGAFGLDEDINNRFFIQRVLGDGITSEDALSNRLADKRYRAFSEAFGFGEGLPPRTLLSGFATEIVAAYRERQFEIAVGEQDESLRLSLAAVRELEDLSVRSVSNDTQWLTIMGTPPLRAVFETAFGLPSAFATLDIDKQREILQEKSARVLGTDQVADFADPDLREQLIKTYLLRNQVQSGLSASAPGQIALQLLGGA